MVTPARQLFFAISLELQAVESFERIQKFLQLEDKFILMATSSSNDSEETQIREKSSKLNSKLSFQGSRHASAIHVKNVAFEWETTSPSIISLRDICFARDSFTAITEPIGCGKSTLLKSFLSKTASAQEISQVSSEDIAYCGQTL